MGSEREGIMKKRRMAVVGIVVILCFCFGQTALGAEKFGVGVNVSFMGTADTGSGDAIDFDGTTLIGLNATAYLNRLISLSVDLGYSQIDLDAGGGIIGAVESAGELNQTPLLVTARVHLPLFDSVDPYVGGGIGYYFNDFDTSDFVTLLGGQITVDDSFAAHINAGLEVIVWESLAFNVDLKYLWSEADLSDPASILSGDLEMRTFVAGVGLKLYF